MHENKLYLIKLIANSRTILKKNILTLVFVLVYY